MATSLARRILEEATSEIDISQSSYAAAARRYKDLGQWFARPEAACARYSPHIYPQGSFRIGTVIRPIDADGEYDLDLGCRLRSGLTKASHTQKELKELVRRDLVDYRHARRIQAPIQSKHRCWRLQYQDELSFHMDAVPSIPESFSGKQALRESVVMAGETQAAAAFLVESTGAITDDRLASFDKISDSWHISNSEGYARWFESRIKLASGLMMERAVKARVSKIDDLPIHDWASPLQMAVKLLKRHRDTMFADECERAPISIIMTTLAARAYKGEPDIHQALFGILSTMDQYVRSASPRVPNPVNPREDFADRWHDPASASLRLEDAFWKWLDRARSDFAILSSAVDAKSVVSRGRETLGLLLESTTFASRLGLIAATTLLSSAATGNLTFPSKPIVPKKPAGFA